MDRIYILNLVKIHDCLTKIAISYCALKILNIFIVIAYSPENFGISVLQRRKHLRDVHGAFINS